MDEAPLDLPAGLAPGSYMLAIGLYVQSNGSALPPLKVTGGPPGSGADYVALGPITVQRLPKEQANSRCFRLDYGNKLVGGASYFRPVYIERVDLRRPTTILCETATWRARRGRRCCGTTSPRRGSEPAKRGAAST